MLYEGARKALVEAYWKIGQRIVEVEQQGAIKAASTVPILINRSKTEIGAALNGAQWF